METMETMEIGGVRGIWRISPGTNFVFVSFAPVQEVGTPSTCPGVSWSDYELTTTALKKLNLNAFLLISVVAKDTITARCLAMKNTIKDKKPDRIASLLLHSISRFDIRIIVDIVIVREMTDEIRIHRNNI